MFGGTEENHRKTSVKKPESGLRIKAGEIIYCYRTNTGYI
jgi:hypothetical protein